MIVPWILVTTIAGWAVVFALIWCIDWLINGRP